MPSTSRLLAVVLLAVVLATGACSSSGSDDSPTATSSTATTSSKTTSTATSSTDASGATCGVHEIDGVQVRTFCGAGSAGLSSAKVTLTLAKAECDTGATYVSVNAGTIVLGNDEATADEVRAKTQYLGLNVGQVPGDSSGVPATKDGTYTGAIVSANDEGTALLAEATSLRVILVSNRTAGSFSGPLVGGGTVTGTFRCA